LQQSQKTGRTSVVVQATTVIHVDCNGKTLWSAILAPTNGSFQNGSGTVTSATTNTTHYMLPASSTSSAKLYWGRK